MNLNTIRQKIKDANAAYRKGESILSDFEYDLLIDTLKEHAPHDPLLNQIGYLDPIDDRKESLPIMMASMNKVKTMKEIEEWFRLKGIPQHTKLVLTPKYDGASLCVYESAGNAWTRGDGIEGQRSDKHFKLLGNTNSDQNVYSFGEVIMSRKNWEKYEDLFANPRNMVAGLLNTKEPTDTLKDCDFIRYGIGNSDNKSKIEQLDICNQLNSILIPYKVVTIDQLSDDYLVDLYKEWNEDYEIDGIIIEIIDNNLRNKLGRETSTDNPAYARAYKGKFEEVKEATVQDVIYQVSKHGYLKPVAIIEPTNLDGATVTKATCFNAKFVQSMGLGIGAKILIKRSGKVIPFIIKVTQPADEISLSKVCPSCGSEVTWNTNKVELCCTGFDCPAQRLQKIIKFFEILGADNVGEGICTQLYEEGYDTLPKILLLEIENLLKLEGFKKRRAMTVFNSLRNSVKGVDLSKLMHASSCFELLGSKKLKLVEHLFDKNPSTDDLIAVKGYSVTSAYAYLKGMEQFKIFLKGLPNVTVNLTAKPTGNNYEGLVFVFTGVRRKDLEEQIEQGGGKVTSSVTKKTTHLVTKEKGSDSGKEKKATALGITIWEVSELEDFLK